MIGIGSLNLRVGGSIPPPRLTSTRCRRFDNCGSREGRPRLSYNLTRMIDLARTEQQMLEEIGVDTCSERGEAAPVAPWRVDGRMPSELLPTLTKALSIRYADVPDRHVSYDLVAVVKKGLGNAYKWGNGRDQGKLLVVTTVMTRMGAVIKISDQGRGFDVARVVRDRLFTRKGSGLTRFRKTSSVISYADGGRTLLIRFLCDPEAERSAARTRITAAGATSSNTFRTDLRDLRPGDLVKVKGILELNGNFLARKVALKAAEQVAVIDAPLQEVLENGRVIRLLNLKVTLPEKTETIDADLRPAGYDRLSAGLVVCLTGSCVPGEGFVPVSIKIRRRQNGHTSELRGRIEAINLADKTFRVVGVTVVTDDQTEVRASAAVST
jgi:hypothetical protein